MRRVRGLLALVLALSACSAAAPAPPAAPAIGGPVDAVPPDLDVVVRVDVAGVRDAIGSTAFALLSARAKQSAAGMDPGSERLIVDLLGRTDTLWLAFRPGLDADHTDNVVVLRGRFEGLDPDTYASSPAWQSPSDLGGAWQEYERARPHARAAPARLFLHGNDLAVLVSWTEIDSVERVIAGRTSSRALTPPESGSFSVAARVRSLAEPLRSRSAAAAQLLGDATTLQATLSLAATGLTARLSVDFESDEPARRAAEATNLLFQGLADQSRTAAELLPHVRVESVGHALVVSANVDRERLSGLAACIATGTCP